MHLWKFLISSAKLLIEVNYSSSSINYHTPLDFLKKSWLLERFSVEWIGLLLSQNSSDPIVDLVLCCGEYNKYGVFCWIGYSFFG